MLRHLVIVVLLVLHFGSSASPAEKPKITFSGFSTSNLTASGDHASFAVEKLFLKPIVSNGKVSLRGLYDPFNRLPVRQMVVRYDACPTLSIEAGRLVTPFASLYPYPYEAASTYLPFDEPALTLPFHDNGVLAGGQFGHLGLRASVQNGSGEYQDNNRSLDVAGQIGVVVPKFEAWLLGQSGRQPNGHRDLAGLNVTLALRRVSFWGSVLNRPDLHAAGVMLTTVIHIGRTDLPFLVEYTDAEPIVRHLDVGLNRRVTDQFRLLLHAIAATVEPPRYVIQLKHSF